ncbi:MAG TPA: hypothetical protein VLL27_02100 [Solirubrobacterales bacterium]|nr:hypothetical protein [Solirubrobacterales bacterium]
MTAARSLNGREEALLAWAAIALFWMLSRRDLRSAMWGVLKAAAKPAIVGSLLALAAWVAGCAWLAEQAGIWETSLVNETVWWFLATGLVIWFSVTRVADEDHVVRKTVARVVTIGLLAEIFINLVVLPFWAEFFLLPLITIVLTLGWFAEGKPEFAPAKKLCEWISSIIGLALFAYVVISLVTNPSQVDLDYLARLVALPIWLTLVTLPFLFVFGLFVAYDKAFRMISFWSEDKKAARRSKLLLFRRLGVRPRRVGRFNTPWQRQLTRAADEEERQAVVERFLREQTASA